MSASWRRTSKTIMNTPMTSATNARTMVGARALVKSIQKIWSVFHRRPIWLWLDHAFWHRDFLIGPSNHGGPWLLLRSEVRPTTTKFLHILIIVRWVGAAFDGRHGSAIASGWDWELLRRIAGRLCPSVSAPTKSARPTNNGNRRRPRKQRRGRRHSTAWFFYLEQVVYREITVGWNNWNTTMKYILEVKRIFNCTWTSSLEVKFKFKILIHLCPDLTVHCIG